MLASWEGADTSPSNYGLLRMAGRDAPRSVASMAAKHSGQHRLAPAALRRTMDPGGLPFESTAEVEPLERMIGQPRAGEALELALELTAPGYNVFATGPSGTGKRSVLEAELRRRAASRPAPCDWVYVHDFSAPARPAAIALPAGRGPELARDADALVVQLRRAIGAAFESEAYRRRHRELHERLGRRRDEAVAALKAAAAERDVAVELAPEGIATLPLDDGRPLSPEAFLALPPERQQRFRNALPELQADVDETLVRLAELEREGREEHARLEREAAGNASRGPIEDMKRRWGGVERVAAWLDALLEDLLGRLDALRAPQADPSLPGVRPVGPRNHDRLARYGVNVFVTRDPDAGAPVIAIHDCSYYEVFGRIDYDTSFGAVTTDHGHIRPGAAHRAAGGYLLLEAKDVLVKPFVWGRLKELLRTGQARIENLGTQYMLFPSASLDPEPIDVGLTVVLIGSNELHRMLHALDDDVPRLFKIRADFDFDTAWDDDGVAGYAGFVSRQVRDRGLLDFDRGAIARIVEHGARLAGDRNRLSTRYPEISDVVVEASQQARRAGGSTVAAEHVERSLAARRRRSDLVEQRLREETLDGTLRIDLTGDVTGQVSGLAVIDRGDHRFGHPIRISATVGPGEGDVVDIDREAELSGPLHDKGVLILAGLLRHLYCRSTPLALRASLVFEQSYGPVEGDSASAAELLALMSALAGAPLAQGIAVTGSVDQRGRLQAIGGVNEKIEGFFALCRDHGLTGEQGVAIPAANARHLMLDPEVVAAARRGAFHVWTIETIDDLIELIAGIQAGEPDAHGAYPRRTFHGRVQARIAELAALARRSERSRPVSRRALALPPAD